MLYRVRHKFAEGKSESHAASAGYQVAGELESAEAGNAILGLTKTFGDSLPPATPIGGFKPAKKPPADGTAGDTTVEKKSRRGKKGKDKEVNEENGEEDLADELETPPPKVETPEQIRAKKKKAFEDMVAQWSNGLKIDESKIRSVARALRETKLKHADGHLQALAAGSNRLREIWMELDNLFESGAEQDRLVKLMTDALPSIVDAREDMDSAELRINPNKKPTKKGKDPFEAGTFKKQIQDAILVTPEKPDPRADQPVAE